MKKKLFIHLIVMIIIPSMAFAQSVNTAFYAEKWKAIQQDITEQLPESALKKLYELKKSAEKEKNLQEDIKINIHIFKLKLEKNPDLYAEILKDLTLYTENFTDSPEKQLLYAQCADFYNHAYHQNQWQTDQRTHVQGDLPDDIKTWSAANYKSVILEYADKSLKNSIISQNTPVQNMNELLITDNINHNITPTLYDLLLYKRIEIANAFEEDVLTEKSWMQLISFRKTKSETTPLVQAELGLLNFRFENEQENENKSFRIALDSLENIYFRDSAVVEIMYAKAKSWYYDSSLSGHNRMAYRICEEGIKKYPGYFRINILKNLINTISEQTLRTSQNDKINPGKSLEIEFLTKNITSIKVNYYRINATAEAYYNFRSNWLNRQKPYPDRTLLEQKNLSIPFNPEFKEIKSTLQLPANQFGIYEFGCLVDGKNDSTEQLTGHFTVTNLAMLKKNDEKNSVYVLDRISGKPVPKVQVKVYNSSWNRSHYELQFKKQSVSDKQGYCNLNLDKNYSLQTIILEKGEDKFFSTSSYSYYFNAPEFEDNTKISIFTDRSVYRPGQTVYFKAIAYQSSKNREKVVSGEKIEIILTDVNGQESGKTILKSNEFGSVTGSFILPTGKLNGNFTLTANQTSSISIKVEEYKRPTFEVTVNQPLDEVYFGEKVTLKGKVKAFAGYNINGSAIQYKIEKSAHPFFRYYYSKQEIIANGKTKTDADGNFEITFIPEKSENSYRIFPEYSIFEVSVDVTSQSGETQQGSTAVSVGERSLIIDARIPSLIKTGEKTAFPVTVKTLQGEVKNKIIDYEIFSLNDSSEFAENLPDDYVFTINELLQKGKFDTKEIQLAVDLHSFSPGRYRIRFITRDNKNKEVTDNHDFIIFDPNSNKLPVKTYAWQISQEIFYVPGQKIKTLFGTSVKNAWVLYETMQKNKVVTAKWIRMNNEVKFFEIKTDKKSRNVSEIRFTLISEEKMFTKNILLKIKKYEKIISPKLKVFRDVLKPGETVNWSAVLDSVRLNQQTEMMIGMYDASLDIFQPHNWNFNPAYQSEYFQSPSWESSIFQREQGWKNFPCDTYTIQEFSKTHINNFGLEVSGYGGRLNPVLFRIQGVAKGLKVNEASEMVENDAVFAVNEVVTTGIMKQGLTSSVVKKEEKTLSLTKKTGNSQPRTNFNETAFFYPQVHCDSAGNFNFSFTVPESLTRWNLQLLAHSKDLFAGVTRQSITTQKDLMIQLNLPRFVRESDEMALSATVINLTDSILNADINLSLLKPDNHSSKYYDYIDKIKLNPGESKVVSCRIKISGEQNLLIAKATAETDNFSDGEQKYLPVLSSKVLVQESLPINIKGGQLKKINFKRLEEIYKTVDTKLLTLEFSSNPVWYAIEALQVLTEPVDGNALDYFTAWYANELASVLSSENPAIQKVFEMIEQTGQTKDNIISNLEKNPELKMMLLEETPWIMDAKDETEQMRRFKTIFELNHQNQLKNEMIDKMEKLQLSSGGFSWFEGMPESRWITQYILRGLSRIKSDDSRINNIRDKAVIYLDNQLFNDLENLKLHLNNYKEVKTINCLQLQYLSFRLKNISTEIPDFAKEAFDYYVQQTIKYKNTFSLYEKALAIMVLHQTGNQSAVESLIKSLRENALQDEETGMFWAKNQAGYSWNERPVSVQTALMEAFSLVTNDRKELDAMKTWLLKQKQTQQWESAIISAEAIHALVTLGNDWMNKPNDVKIQVGNKEIKSDKSVPGSGYIKTQVQAEDVSKGIVIQSISENQSPSWGAIHWQYLQEMNKITGSGSGLSVKKQLMTEKIIDNKPVLIPINHANDKNQVKKGDKIISRIVVSTDRNLEFVVLRDLKAACLEPVNQTSACNLKQGVIYYRNPKDASVNYFFQYLPKGTYVFEDEYFVVNTGDYTGGNASIQCLYAPEFIANGAGEKISIKD